MHFSKAVSYFKRYNTNKYSGRTLEIYGLQLRRFCVFINDKEVEDIHLFDDVLEYQQQLEGLGRSDNTINLAMIAIRQLFIMLDNMESQLDIKLPFKAGLIPIKKEVSVRPHEPITEEQFNTFINAIRTCEKTQPFIRIRDEAIFRVLYDSGMRVSELTSLNLSDIDLNRSAIEVITLKRKDANRKREVYWTEATDEVLRKYLELRKDYSGEALFVNARDGDRINRRSIQRSMRIYKANCGMKDIRISPHSFRHGLGMRAVEKRIYPPLLQAYLGHKNPASSQVYYNIQNDNLRSEFMTKMS